MMFPQHEAGHLFLSRLGKKRLRPGGKRGTDWLIAQVPIDAGTQVLEVACNVGTTALDLTQRFGCTVTGIDLDERALALAQHSAAGQGVADRATFRQGDARSLPFDDGSFDIVINEAMLSMHDADGKAQAVCEYRRVLKPGGYLLTHDLTVDDLRHDAESAIDRLRKTINHKAAPLTREGWIALFASHGFEVSDCTGPMSLLSPHGMVRDEGLESALCILENAFRRENREMFFKMYDLFYQSAERFGFIAACSRKPL